MQFRATMRSKISTQPASNGPVVEFFLSGNIMKASTLKPLLIVILCFISSIYLSHVNLAQTDRNASDEKVYDAKDVDTKVKVLSQPDCLQQS